MLEVDFAGDEELAYDLRAFRPRLKAKLMKCLVADGVAFQEMTCPDDWRGGDDAVSKVETVVDAWVLESKYPCSKARDRLSRKARWVLECEEQVTILMLPGEGRIAG